ncbi:DNA-processing protein DprA [Ewingella allii]|uniref:DNA-processing protein DprA n=1 Tax=Ewingella allii TaxID=3092550 RepID=UPI0037A0DB87
MDTKLDLSPSKLASWSHAALILSKKVQTGSKKANDELKYLLTEFKSIEGIYEHFFSMVPIDHDLATKLDSLYSKIKFEMDYLTINDPGYPNTLRDIKGVPPIIYFRGNSDILKLSKSIAFVGTRELDNDLHRIQGVEAIKRLFNAGYKVIVSGLAKGSDTLGHRTALDLGGKTIAVLGTPLDKSYPSENKLLQEEIANSNLLVSEYPIGILTQGSSFANRNLTTVSLSTHGVVVARASDKSGTQHAIKACLEQNKPLYILENNIHEPEYTWVAKNKAILKLIK